MNNQKIIVITLSDVLLTMFAVILLWYICMSVMPILSAGVLFQCMEYCQLMCACYFKTVMH